MAAATPCHGYARRLIAWVSLVTALSGPACSESNSPGVDPGTTNVDGLWNATVGPWLAHDLWSDAERYGAGQGLMVPLHAAFSERHRAWQRAFADQFRRFTSGRTSITLSPETDLSWLQFLYLGSQFLVLSARTSRNEPVAPPLVELLARTAHELWREVPAWQWDRDPFPGGMAERLAWKLHVSSPARSYYRAVVDDEMFLFAIAGDLRQYERLSGRLTPYSQELTTILETAGEVYRQRVVQLPQGGWLFQPGVWTDHPDDQFAGRTEKSVALAPLPRAGVAEDASHSHRMPLWLRSLRDAHARESADYRYYDSLLAGLERQFFSRVLRPPSFEFPGFRTTNFMDGWNGVYGSEVTRGRTYGPYELSGTLTYGWWAFLGSTRSRGLYQALAQGFPLPPTVVRLYTGPDTIGPPHPVLGKPLGFFNGYRQLVVELAAGL